MAIPQSPNQRWCFDFVSGAPDWDRRFWELAVVDDFTREALALVVDTSLSGAPAMRTGVATPHLLADWLGIFTPIIVARH